MTVVNASTSTEGFRLTPVSNQLAFSAQDPGGLNGNDTEYSWLTTGGDDVEVTGTGIDFQNDPPAFGIADAITIDLSDNLFTQPDVFISSITGPTSNGEDSTGADMAVITLGALDFFNELMSFGDTMIGSDFDDTFNGGGGGDTLSMGDGDDVAFGGIGADEINGDDGDDTLNGEGNNDTLNGGEGEDTLNGGLGADDMDGGENDDTYIVDNANDTAAEGVSGIDLVQASVTHELSDNIEDLTLTGTADIDGTGNDLDNSFLGNVGDNVLTGLDGEDFMNGSSGADTLLGGADNDTLQGSFGRDTLDGGTGADTMDGSFGNDTYIVDNLGDVAADSGNGTDHVLSSVTHFLDADIENLTLTGAAASDGTGNGGDNIIIGNGAINVLSGLGGRDTLDGGVGADDMFGGGGNDTYIVDDAGDTTTEFNGGGTDRVSASVTTSLDTNVENLTLTGTADIDGTGNGSDNDIVGNSGDNLLSGGGGADTLIGGDGRDTLEGDGGNDVFVFNTVGESGPFAAQADFIIGFDGAGAGAGDVIDLSGIDAVNGVAGSAFNFLGVIQTPFPPETVAGDLWLRNEGGNTVVYGTTDDDNATEFAIRISDGGVAPADYDASDFIL